VFRNFGLFALGMCSVFNSGLNCGIFVLRSVVFSLVDAILAYLH
jgi:hypothetical protein